MSSKMIFVAAALLALFGSSVAQFTVPCSTLSISSDSTCSSTCQGLPHTWSTANDGTCSCNGITICGGSGSFPDVSIPDVTFPDFTFPDINPGETPCSINGVGITDATACTAACTAANLASSSWNSANGGSCSCNNIQICGGGSSANADDDDTPSEQDLINLIRQSLTEELGSECGSAVNRAITQDVITCFQQFEEVEFDPFTSGVTEQCNNGCWPKLFRGVDILVRAGCVTPATAVSFNDDDDQDDDDSIATSIGYVAAFQSVYEGFCARGGDQLCGNLLPALAGLFEQGSIDATGCTNIVGAGKCLGTLINTFSGVTIDGVTSEQVTGLAALLNTQCEAQGVTGVTEAASGTEAPANTSAATGVSALFGAALLAAVAALLA